MKTVITNISPLPFYDDIAKQNHRKDYAFGQIYPLITHKDTILPFQVPVYRESGATSIAGVYLHDVNKKTVTDITTVMKDNGLHISESGTNANCIKYPGLLPVPAISHEGLYYLSITLNNDVDIYSDIFTSCNVVDNYLLLQYSNSYDFILKDCNIDFSDNFEFRCYLNTQLGKPEYDFEEEASERLGYSFIESQVSKKIYKFTALMPEYLCDALRIVRLCDTKQITNRNDTYDAITFSMEPSWEDQGDLASVECEFEIDTIIANLGGYSPLHGDYNSDFNTDFYNEYNNPFK